ncbi:MAG: biotin synthase BioB [Bacteroidales bacterium]
MEIKELLDRVLDGGKISRAEAIELVNCADKGALYKASERVTRHWMGDKFDCCSIINAKSGNCSEDCKWCAQSAFYKTKVEKYPMVDKMESLRQGEHNYGQGIGRFSLVTSGRKLSAKDVREVGEHYKLLREKCGIKRCASFGLMEYEDLVYLKECGVDTYHCNMETSKSYFGKLCTTHTPDDKQHTIQAARKAGMRVCSGGIIGMGESMEDRVDMAIMLREMGIRSIPLNILQPIKGTPLGESAPLTEQEILTTIAIFRMINPRAFIRFSGGRAQLSPESQRLSLKIGVNAAITGDLLTTVGSTVERDMRLIRKAGYKLDIDTDWDE